MRELVGRDGALARARGALAGPGVAVVVGASGIGKTAIADRLADEARTAGRRVVEIRGTHGLHTVPFGALATYLRLGAGGGRTEMAARIADAVLGSEEVLVSVDDAHLLDDDSAGLLVSLAAEPGVRLLLTVVSGMSVPPDVAGLWGRWPECRIELRPLDRDEVGVLARSLMGGEDPGEDLLDRIAAVTLGYPLYVTALVSEMAGPAGGDLPTDSGRLVGLFERRMARLDRDDRRLLDLVAFADSLPLSLVPHLPSGSALDALERDGLIRERAERVEISHPLLAEVAVSTLTVDGRRRCAEELLAAATSAGDDAVRSFVVERALEAGVVPEPPLLAIAARDALARQDFRHAAELTAHTPEAAELAELRAEALRHLGEVPAEVPSSVDEDTRTRMLATRAQALAFVERRFGEAIDVLERGIASTTDPANRTRLAMETMVLSGLVGDLDSLLGAARAVGDDGDTDTRLLAEATSLLAEGLTLTTSASGETYRRGRELVASGVTDPLLPDRLEMSRIVVALAEGRLLEARRLVDGLRDTRALGALLTVESLLAGAWLPPVDALALAGRAVAALEGFDPLGNMPQARIVAAIRAAQAGRTDAIDGLELLDDDADDGVVRLDRTMRDRARAWSAWADGDPGAGKLVSDAARRAVEAGHRFWGLCGLLDAVRLGHGPEVAADIEQLAVVRGSGLAAIGSRHARAGSPSDLGAVARTWWRAGAPTYAVEAAIRAVEGGTVLHRAAVQLLALRGAVPVVGALGDVEPPLSSRQAEVVSHVLDGRSNRETAEVLFLSKRTVDNHLRLAYGALGLADGREGLLDTFGWISADPGESTSGISFP